MGNIICSAFPGTGKTYLCNKFPEKYIELECWKYRDVNFPFNYVNDIILTELIINNTDTLKKLFISTDPLVLKHLRYYGCNIILVYPNISLKEEYIDRYIEREEDFEFINMMKNNWDEWIKELQLLTFGSKIILNSGEFLGDVIEDD